MLITSSFFYFSPLTLFFFFLSFSFIAFFCVDNTRYDIFSFLHVVLIDMMKKNFPRKAVKCPSFTYLYRFQQRIRDERLSVW